MIQRPAKLCRYTSPEHVKQAMSYVNVEIKGSIYAIQYLLDKRQHKLTGHSWSCKKNIYLVPSLYRKSRKKQSGYSHKKRRFLPLAAPIQTDSLVGQSRTFLLDASPTKQKDNGYKRGYSK